MLAAGISTASSMLIERPSLIIDDPGKIRRHSFDLVALTRQFTSLGFSVPARATCVIPLVE